VVNGAEGDFLPGFVSISIILNSDVLQSQRKASTSS
jgi:hypothetical protein